MFTLADCGFCLPQVPGSNPSIDNNCLYCNRFQRMDYSILWWVKDIVSRTLHFKSWQFEKVRTTLWHSERFEYDFIWEWPKRSKNAFFEKRKLTHLIGTKTINTEYTRINIKTYKASIFVMIIFFSRNIALPGLIAFFLKIYKFI